MNQNPVNEERSAEDPSLQTIPLVELFGRLSSSPEGLSPTEAARRLEKVGYNELQEREPSAFRKLLTFFWGPIPWMIEAAALLSALVGHWEDFGIIIVLLMVNAVVGFWEEYQAGNAIAALKQTLALKAKARRGGEWQSVPARELVPGDVIRLRLGDIVPADGRLIEGNPLEVDQSALTGESLPVSRGVGEAVYSGTVVRRGEGNALVYATGRETSFGKTARLVEEARTVSHFQRAVLKIGDYLIIVAIGLVLLIIAVALFRGDPIGETLQFALVLTVAAIPVAMPTILSVTMAVGARILAGRQAIVSRLAAIEELAGMDILCSDKTGTLTKNELTLGAPSCTEGIDPDAVILAAALASRREDADPIDLAILRKLPAGASLEGYRVLRFVPFDPVTKRTEATVSAPDGTTFTVTKGAPQVIVGLASPPPEVRARIDAAVEAFAARGFRSLGVARADKEGAWRMLGILPLFDPPRDDSRETLAAARRMGTRVKMVTGDQLAIAREIGRELGLGDRILDAALLTGADYREASRLADAIDKADGFAQVFPEHKFHIVEALQQQGHIVGMTGDGVNDAPALKKADAGIAVSGATDAARAAADIVLLTPGLSVIIDAVTESRRIFRRMNSYTIYRISETIRVLLFITLSILVFNFYPVTAVMIVLLALLNDGAILAIAVDRQEAAPEPQSWNMPVVLGVSTVLGIVGVVATFGLYYLAERLSGLGRDVIQSLIYLKLSVSGHLTIFAARARGPFWSNRPATALLAATVGTQLVATAIAVYGLFMAPIGWAWGGIVWAYALVWFVIEDRVKLGAYRIFDRRAPGLLEKVRR
ncbi:plasma-membrane proton-efflux P-type ATPase [Geobacter metallireducens RCH3]|uniref:Cation-translocating P-type ATPase n=2 Tax=Geobacter metallireducens TaxID=28232 RepID=Q39PX2_GEOMG|nr:cation-translocating P-type ATPase [Geobacter metallireducens GS-15]EHP85803.1 plasma-membrane proton-efflux P-type ATPase [Geobacter metallireducens RCH3]